MFLEIAVHCWRYPRLLTYHLSSLFLHPPVRTRVLCTVFCAECREDDPPVAGVLEHFLSLPAPPEVRIRAVRLPRKRLLNRTIGRNIAARATQADWVWFADCDMVFGEGALDALEPELAACNPDLAFPSSVRMHASHELGDRAIERAAGEPRLLEIDPTEFVPSTYQVAIGGAQIVRASTARRIGYCDTPRRQRSADVWKRSYSDVAFRRTIGSPGVPIGVPNVFRIRHSRNGRTEPGIVL